MLKKIAFDLETQNLFEEVGGKGKTHLLKVSVCGIYDYARDVYEVYEEKELPRLGTIIQSADLLIGYNSKAFDSEVLQPYLQFNIQEIPHFDIMEEISKVIGHRIALETVAQGTLGTGKSGNGKQAVLYYRNGRMDLLKKYCLDDVKVTKAIYDYALKNQKILYRDYFSVKEIPLNVTEPAPRVGVYHQATLF